jgi:hypothetical protein
MDLRGVGEGAGAEELVSAGEAVARRGTQVLLT